MYGPIVVVNLVDKGGREKILGDAYLSNVLRHNSPELTYLSFDFHEHCRGMHFENVATVISRLEDVFSAMSYCWVDSYGIVLQQKGVLRVNCVDCLDRTNLTQVNCEISSKFIANLANFSGFQDKNANLCSENENLCQFRKFVGKICTFAANFLRIYAGGINF